MESDQVLFCDNHLLVLDKPAGLLTQPAGVQDDSLETRGRLWLKERFDKPGNVFLEAVHRIDKAVCGAVLFARTSKALSRLNSAMRNGSIQKIYRAYVEGRIQEADGEFNDWLAHDDFRARIVRAGDPAGRECRLKYRVLDRGASFSLVEIQLETGRYHQIRAQFASHGHPVAGDFKYGALRAYSSDGIALQSHSLSFAHPVGGAQLKFVSRIHLNVPN